MRHILGPDWKEGYLFIFPALFLLGTIVAYPFLRAFYTGFTRTTSLEIGPWVGLLNYQNLYKDPFFWDSVRISLTYTITAVVLKFFIGMIAALLLHRLTRFAAVFTALVMLPWIMPEVVRAITWKGLLDPIYGMVNPLLKDLGLIEKSIPFFGTPELALPSVIMVNLWAGIPFFTLLLVAGLKAIDKEQYEAAAIDGASGWRQFLHITLPGLQYVILVETLLSFIWTFNGFTQVFLLTGGGPLGSTKMYTIFAIEAARSFRIGTAVAAAMSMVPLLVILIIILGRNVLATQTGRSAQTAAEQNTSLFGLISWPFRMIIGLFGAIFWVINDGIERIFEAIGSVFRKMRPLSHDAHAAARRSKAARRRVGIVAGVILTLLLIFELFPFYFVFITSFKHEAQIVSFQSLYYPEPWTLAQYEKLLGPTRNFLVWMRNSMIISLVTPLVSTIVASLAAYSLVRLNWKGNRFFSSAVFAAYLMPGVLLVISIYQIFAKVGLTNSLYGLMIAYSTFALPFAIWLMMGYYASIPRELEDAGLIDGCNRFQVFWRIVLPLTKPALMAIFLFGVTNAWHEYLFAYILISKQSLMTLPVGLGMMIIGDVQPWGELTGASMIMAIPVFILYSIGQRFMVAGLTAGAVKGGG
ncbi:MAG: ABC transporter permease subunit [Caldilineaceae bacterium]|nr:ABC transporter permease subunit [Caldilineaceae bacterium]HRJ41679.1 ABC transporter permease subunit [Caldilineaceae bacterium]